MTIFFEHDAIPAAIRAHAFMYGLISILYEFRLQHDKYVDVNSGGERCPQRMVISGVLTTTAPKHCSPGLARPPTVPARYPRVIWRGVIEDLPNRPDV